MCRASRYTRYVSTRPQRLSPGNAIPACPTPALVAEPWDRSAGLFLLQHEGQCAHWYRQRYDRRGDLQVDDRYSGHRRLEALCDDPAVPPPPAVWRRRCAVLCRLSGAAAVPIGAYSGRAGQRHAGQPAQPRTRSRGDVRGRVWGTAVPSMRKPHGVEDGNQGRECGKYLLGLLPISAVQRHPALVPVGKAKAGRAPATLTGGPLAPPRRFQSREQSHPGRLSRLQEAPQAFGSR